MTSVFVLTCVWFIVANLVAMLPSRDQHWTAAYVLIACGVPLLGWLTAVHGPVIGMIALAAGASVLRWPLILLVRRLQGASRPPRQEPAE